MFCLRPWKQSWQRQSRSVSWQRLCRSIARAPVQVAAFLGERQDSRASDAQGRRASADLKEQCTLLIISPGSASSPLVKSPFHTERHHPRTQGSCSAAHLHNLKHPATCDTRGRPCGYPIQQADHPGRALTRMLSLPYLHMRRRASAISHGPEHGSRCTCLAPLAEHTGRCMLYDVLRTAQAEKQVKKRHIQLEHALLASHDPASRTRV